MKTVIANAKLRHLHILLGTRVAKLFSALLLLSISLPSLAQSDERWFSIQVIVFERLKNNAHLEHWPVPQNLAFPQPRLFFPSDSNALSASGIQEMEFSGPLSEALQKLNRSSAYRVLTAKQWQQSLLPKKQAPHLVFKGGQQVAGRYELEGSLQFSVERYLHLNANLWFTEFAADGEVSDSYVAPANLQLDTGTFGNEETSEPESETVAPAWTLPALPEPPLVSLLDQTDEMPANNDELSDAAASDLAEENLAEHEATETISTDIIPAWPIERIVTLQQQRRLRSTETHYIDHPLLGMLVHILPVETAPASNSEDDIL
jgi:hypothetical protein